MAVGIVRAWHRLSQNGTTGLSLEEARKTRSLNQFIFIAIVSYASYSIGYATDLATFKWPFVVTLACAAVHASLLSVIRRGHRVLAVTVFLAVLNAHMAYASYFCGSAVGFHYYFMAFTTAVPLMVPRRHLVLYLFSPLAGACFVYFAYFYDGAVADIDPFYGHVIMFVTIIATMATLIIISILFDSDAHHAEEQLVVEHDRSEKLLLNVLPPSISDRLKSGQESIADGFADVSVLFADIVGFTELSARLPPEELVRVLSEVFSRFDDLAEEHGLEKIKTIGDAYMVAAGLPEPRADHAVAATRMALGMTQALQRVNEQHGHKLEVRIGINSGPVVAGVIGKKKFIYDLWGDTVNTASRMESHGQKGTVHVTESTARLIEGEFELECRGTIHVKGKGEMKTYFVVGARAPKSHARAALASEKTDVVELPA